MKIDRSGRILMCSGAVLYLISLLQGLVISHFVIPKMALSAHQAGIEGGIVLILFGVMWGALYLREGTKKLAMYASIGGMYIVWFAITLASILGANKALPIAGEGFGSTTLNELTVQGLIMLGGTFCLVSAVLVVVGLYRKQAVETSSKLDVMSNQRTV